VNYKTFSFELIRLYYIVREVSIRLYYIVREVSLFWPTLYILVRRTALWLSISRASKLWLSL